MQPIACAAIDDPFVCPEKWAIWRQLLALFPPGRAWQRGAEEVHDLIITEPAGEVGTFESGVSGLGSVPVLDRLTEQQQYMAAIAEVLEYLHQRACALLAEMFCSTVNEMREEMAIDYGFPDPCEPYHTLCEKVAAQGGATKAFYIAIALAQGWVISIEETGLNELEITVDLASPAYHAPPVTEARAGGARAGGSVLCAPGLEGLVCLIERFKQAHLAITYVLP